MKKFLISVVVLIIIAAVVFVGLLWASDFEVSNIKNLFIRGNGNKDTYTIQYEYDGIQQISVKDGELYSIESIPAKNGYVFDGLYDAPIDGVKYVGSNGMCISAFSDKKNIILYPQFVPFEYGIVLDAQGGTVYDFDANTKISYNETFSYLPTNVILEHKDFVGWFTQTNGRGIQVADSNGVLSGGIRVTEDDFDLSSGSIKLYAHYKNAQVALRLFVDQSSYDYVDYKVDYCTDIDDVEYIFHGKRVLTWSIVRGDTYKNNVFSGNITEPIDLYATEFGIPVRFNALGGASVASRYELAGATITLPNSTRYKYDTLAGWSYNGSVFSSTFTVPDVDEVVLSAVWNSNGWKYISNYEEFNAIKSNLAGKYCLLADLDLGEWTPIGNNAWHRSSNWATQCFSGTIDGDNHKIKYKINIFTQIKENCYAWGLIASADGAEIKNLNIETNIYADNSNLSTCSYVGGVVGWANRCTITNCTVRGSINQNHNGTDDYGIVRSAGIAGKAYSTVFTNCQNYASINAASFNAAGAGICAGSDSGCKFEKCSNNSSIRTNHGDWVYGADYSNDLAVDMYKGKNRTAWGVNCQKYD